jgi:hypothetical protein
MDASNKDRSGEELLATIVQLTGLEEGAVRGELDRIVAGAGHSKEEVTLEQVRSALLAYLETLHSDFTGSGSGFQPH